MTALNLKSALTEAKINVTDDGVLFIPKTKKNKILFMGYIEKSTKQLTELMKDKEMRSIFSLIDSGLDMEEVSNDKDMLKNFDIKNLDKILKMQETIKSIDKETEKTKPELFKMIHGGEKKVDDYLSEIDFDKKEVILDKETVKAIILEEILKLCNLEYLPQGRKPKHKKK